MARIRGSADDDAHGAYWTVREVAEHYRLHPETVRRWIAKGAIKSVRLGDGPKPRIRVRDEDVEE